MQDVLFFACHPSQLVRATEASYSLVRPTEASYSLVRPTERRPTSLSDPLRSPTPYKMKNEKWKMTNDK